MYALAVGISKVGDTLPGPVYALLSGLNAATVGIIALAAIQLSEKAITDKLTRSLVFLGGAAGMLYNALWYFPVLLVLAGIVTVVWDLRWLHPLWKKALSLIKKPKGSVVGSEVELRDTPSQSATPKDASPADAQEISSEPVQTVDEERRIPAERRFPISWKSGTAVVVGFLATFTTVMIIRGVVRDRPILFNLFANLYLAGTIIFGGGPVVIPLLRQ
jgi:chromate transport protein ChrA